MEILPGMQKYFSMVSIFDPYTGFYHLSFIFAKSFNPRLMKKVLLTNLFLVFMLPLFAQNYGGLSDQDMQEGLEALQKMMGSTNASADVAESYSFTNSVLIHVRTYGDKNKDAEMDLKMLFPDEESYYGMELIELSGNKGKTPQALIIFDYLNYKMISLMEDGGQKIGFAMDLNMDQIQEWQDAEENEQLQDLSFSKTGKTKKILGYTCEQYIMEGTSGKGEYWVSDNPSLKIGIALNSMANSSKNKNLKMPDNYPDGAILEMSFDDENGNGMTWLAKSIDQNKQTIKTANYSFLSLGQ
jgi:hypothetical protein